MNHKKSMRIFWLSLCLLVVSGTIIIAAVQYRSHKKDSKDPYEHEENSGQSGRMTPQAEPEDVYNHAADSSALQPGTENNSAGTQTQPVSGNTAEYRFELKVKDGYLDVYHYHTDNLFFHTGIPYSATTLKQRQELEAGKYFLNEQEMYGYLESCTS